MEQFTLFNPGFTAEADIVRSGWFNPDFTLTDGLNIYGRLSYRGWRRVGLIETSRESWTIEPGRLFTRDLIINDASTGQNIAVLKTTLWRGRVTLEFAGGQTFAFVRGPFFSRKHFWFSVQYGNLLTIETSRFSLKRPFKLTFDQGTFKNPAWLILMTFIGVQLITMRRAHAAASIH